MFGLVVGTRVSWAVWELRLQNLQLLIPGLVAQSHRSWCFWGRPGSTTGMPEFSGSLPTAITLITGSEFLYLARLVEHSIQGSNLSGFPGHLHDICE